MRPFTEADILQFACEPDLDLELERQAFDILELPGKRNILVRIKAWFAASAAAFTLEVCHG